MSYPVLLGAIVVTTGVNDIIKFKEGGGGTLDATLLPGTYYLRGDDSASDICKVIKTAIDVLGSTWASLTINSRDSDAGQPSIEVSVSYDGVSTCQFGTTGTTFDIALLGFAAAQTGAVSYLSTKSPSSCWVSPTPHRELEPTVSQVASVRTTLSGRVRGLARSARMRRWRMSLDLVREERVLSSKNTSDPNATLENFLDDYGAGASIELHDCDVIAGLTELETTDSGTLVEEVCFTLETIQTFAPRRSAPGTPLYGFDIEMHKRVAI